MANKFKAGMLNFIEVLNQMWDAFVVGPYNALSLAGGALTGRLIAPSVIAVREPLYSVNTVTGAGWMKIAKVKLGLQGADIVIRVSGTTSYDAKPTNSSGSLTTILARIDNDNRVRGSFHTEVPHAFSAPNEVIFGTDGTVYMLVGNFLQLSVHIDSHSQCWEAQPVEYHSATLLPPEGIYAVKQWGLRLGNEGQSLHVTPSDITSSCNIRAQWLIPNGDNLYDVGLPAQAYRTIYARTGTINTSDARLKCDWQDLTPSEIAAACALARAVRSYRWIDSVTDKGDAARRHIGPTVQDAIEIMKAHDLDPFSYGFICHDRWDREVIDHPAIQARAAVPPTKEVPAILAENGIVIKPAIPAAPGWPAVDALEAYTEVVREAGDRYAFRYAELSMFIAAGQAARQDALEQRLAALEAA